MHKQIPTTKTAAEMKNKIFLAIAIIILLGMGFRRDDLSEKRIRFIGSAYIINYEKRTEVAVIRYIISYSFSEANDMFNKEIKRIEIKEGGKLSDSWVCQVTDDNTFIQLIKK